MVLCMLDDLGIESTLLGKTHIGREGTVWNPLARGPGGALFHHSVDLLKGETLGLWDQEVGVEEAANAEGSPDVKNLGSQVGLIRVNHVRSDDGNDTVPQPVRRRRQTNTTRTNREWEDLADDNPSTWSPRCCKKL